MTAGIDTPAEMLNLSGKVIIVTGAGGGIGTGIMRRLWSVGATVVAHTRSSDIGRAPDGRSPTVVRADLTADGGPARVVDAALEAHGRLDGLINNAGIQPVVGFAEMSDDEWSEMIDTNLTAVHRLTQRAAEAMEEGGSIVHIASIEGSHPTPVHGHYATSKAALIMHARAAALSYGSRGIRVNSVSPGLIARPGIEEAWPEGVERWRSAAPLSRLGEPEDVGDACVFLCSNLSRWITGIDLVVDGGVLTNPTW